MKLTSLDEACSALVAIDLARSAPPGPWTAAQVLIHCAQSIEYSLSGFPRNKSRLFQSVLGRLALGKFLRQGYMRHNLKAPIPGAPLPEAIDPEAARNRLLKAIADFQAHDGAFAPHFAYGPVEKSRYDRVQAMHIADHLASFA
ncbi:MAG TPA: DUF1569 domain-containing protein [Polyangia bacterium]|nr:DUF1569 domain-containing protein [Polyangia bacterium]